MYKKNIRNIAMFLLFMQLVFALFHLCMLFAKAIKTEPIPETKEEVEQVEEDDNDTTMEFLYASSTVRLKPINISERSVPFGASDAGMAVILDISDIVIPSPTSTPTPTPTSTPSPTPSPTNTPTATPTPKPTSTPKPTATPKPTSTPAPTVEVSNTVSSGRYYIYTGAITEQDIRDMAALLWLEAGGQPLKCKQAIVSVMINLAVRRGTSIHNTIFNRRTFSPAGRIRSTTPSQECLNVVRDIVVNGTTVPTNVLAFRNRHYHNFGRPYAKIGAVYFSTM